MSLSNPDFCRPYLPPEWAPQSGVMLTWPHAHGDWGPHLSEVEPVFVAIARAIADREPVLCVCFDAAHRAHVDRQLRESGVAVSRVIYALAASNDSWARDHGPIGVVCRNRPLLLDFAFNGWGGKYPAELDNAISRQVAQQGVFRDTPLEPVDLVLEGGSIEVDGSGSLLTTTRCLLAPTRNPQVSREQLERQLGDWLGIRQVLWLDHGYLAGDDTDSHIDTLARFCDYGTIAYVACDDPTDEHYSELAAMERQLRTLPSRSGDPYRLVPLPWPRAQYDEHGRRMPATYANFLIINGAVLVPAYDDPADEAARQRVQECFPDRAIVSIPCLPLIRQHGSLHCVTMQLPAGVLAAT
ncbi:MAG: agmatine deiminase family protein [Gammaproteobacteria bacterium]|nr:agmatine deiminase family protein [Gammaproteobacteria bacterium]